MSVPQKGHFRLSALSHLTVSLICLPHLEHVISSGKLSKNISLVHRMNKISLLGKCRSRRPRTPACFALHTAMTNFRSHSIRHTCHAHIQYFLHRAFHTSDNPVSINDTRIVEHFDMGAANMVRAAKAMQSERALIIALIMAV